MRVRTLLLMLALVPLVVPGSTADPAGGASTDCSAPALLETGPLNAQYAQGTIAPGERHYWRYTLEPDAEHVYFELAAAGAHLDVRVATGDPCDDNACSYGEGIELPVHTSGGGCGSSARPTWTFIITPAPGSFVLDGAEYILRASPCWPYDTGFVPCSTGAAA